MGLRRKTLSGAVALAFDTARGRICHHCQPGRPVIAESVYRQYALAAFLAAPRHDLGIDRRARALGCADIVMGYVS